jgi:hypothetical protein
MSKVLTITREPTGTILREARESFELSREEVAARTKVPLSYVVLLEEGVSEAGSGMDAYTKIYLKAYAKFLGLDPAIMVQSFAIESQRANDRHRPPSTRRHPLTAVPGKAMASGPRIVRIVVGILIVLGVIAFFISQIRDLIAPPAITILSPKDGTVTTDPAITIEGRTEPEVSLLVNGTAVGVGDDGRFTDSMDLQEGLNVIRIVGTRKHSKEMVVERRVIVEPKEQKAAMAGEEVFELDQQTTTIE